MCPQTHIAITMDLVQQIIEGMSSFASVIYIKENIKVLEFSIKRKCTTTPAVVMALALIFDFPVVSQTANLEGFVR